MKILKRIFYTIFGLLMATTLALIGVILYAEFTGHRFSMDNHASGKNSPDAESRLAYDENGNLAELPGSEDAPTEQAAAEQVSPDSSTNAGSADPSAASPDSQTDASQAGASIDSVAGTDVSSSGSETAPDAAANAPTGEAANPNDGAGTGGASSADQGDETERSYIMDTSSGLFHTDTCTDAAAIAVDQRTERTTTRTKILDAGYQPCPNCNP